MNFVFVWLFFFVRSHHHRKNRSTSLDKPCELNNFIEFDFILKIFALDKLISSNRKEKKTKSKDLIEWENKYKSKFRCSLVHNIPPAHAHPIRSRKQINFYWKTINEMKKKPTTTTNRYQFVDVIALQRLEKKKTTNFCLATNDLFVNAHTACKLNNHPINIICVFNFLFFFRFDLLIKINYTNITSNWPHQLSHFTKFI